MDKNSILAFNNKESVPDVLSELLREGAQQLIHQAVESELSEYLSQHQRLTDDGRVAVVRNGYLPKREILTGIGPVSVRIPKVRSRDGEPLTFRSALVPPYVRKTRSLEAALPWLYLKGVSTGEMGEALKVLVGHDAQGLSASTVSRLKSEWANEYQHWREKPLDEDRWVYIWADGIYSGLRSEQDKLCALVIIGVNERGQKQFLAIEDGVRESTQSWREVLLKLKNRGMNVPQLAIGDGAMGFWAAMDEVYPQTRHQRCWVHKTANILNSLPKSSQPKAKEAIHQIWQAETKINAEKAFKLFIETYQDKYPKATLSLQKDREELLAFYDFPAKHWQSIRTSNPIESTFGTIRHRTRRTKGCLNREGMLHMMFKLGQCAEKNWRK
ncbi:MAG: IS256 family transposase, partial [Candidatus Marinimicrobia bacterium]|nr:IS256 family transposase [Candidatus Neomarinimicrobiota bacterium]